MRDREWYAAEIFGCAYAVSCVSTEGRIWEDRRHRVRTVVTHLSVYHAACAGRITRDGLRDGRESASARKRACPGT